MSWSFLPITEGDIPILLEWLGRPHVTEWWGIQPTREEALEEFLPIIAGNPNHRVFIAHLHGKPTGFIQFYAATAFHDEGWWLDEQDPGVRGIDQFLANPEDLNKGYGTEMIRAFVKMIFADPKVTRIQTDPSPGNARAIRCYAKAGFVPSHEAETPGGIGLIMYCERPD